MTAEEFAYWRAYHAMQPFGDPRADLRSAMVVSMVHNMAGMRAKRPLKVSECLLDFRRQTPEAKRRRVSEGLSRLRQIAEDMNGKHRNRPS